MAPFSTITSPRLIPTRNTIPCSSGVSALRSAIPSLDCSRAGDRPSNAREFNQDTVAGGLNDAPRARQPLDREFATTCSEPCEAAGFVMSYEAAVTGDIGGKDSREPAFDPLSAQCSLFPRATRLNESRPIKCRKMSLAQQHALDRQAHRNSPHMRESRDAFPGPLHYSWRTTNRSAADSAVVIASITAMATHPIMNEPVASLIQPTRNGPKKPPSEPIVEMKASPPAAPRPARKLVGTVQKIARAEVTPTSATVSPIKAGANSVNSTGPLREHTRFSTQTTYYVAVHRNPSRFDQGCFSGCGLS